MYNIQFSCQCRMLVKRPKKKKVKTCTLTLMFGYTWGYEWHIDVELEVNRRKAIKTKTKLSSYWRRSGFVLCICTHVKTVTLKMDMEDDTTVFQTLKSFNSFISQSDAPQRPSELSADCGKLQSQYNRSIEVPINLQHHHDCLSCGRAALICYITGFVL